MRSIVSSMTKVETQKMKVRGETISYHFRCELILVRKIEFSPHDLLYEIFHRNDIYLVKKFVENYKIIPFNLITPPPKIITELVSSNDWQW